MKKTSMKARSVTTTLMMFGSLAGVANAALILNVLESSPATFTATISGNMSGVDLNLENNDVFYVFATDGEGNPLSNLFSSASMVASGTIDLSHLADGKAAFDAASTNVFALNPDADSFLVRFSSWAPSAASVITTVIAISSSGSFNFSDVSRFHVSLGKPDFSSLPEPSSLLLFGLGIAGLTLRRSGIK